jgi:cardiolipin synthase
MSEKPLLFKRRRSVTFPIREMYIEAIDRAEQSILLTNASFVPDHSVLEALTAAVARGVDVRVLVPWPSHTILVDRIACSSFTQCLQAGMCLYGFRQGSMRSKTCTIDGQWSTIGSAPLDLLSSVVNYELNIEIYDAAFAAQMQKLFAHDIAEAHELSLTTWQNRPWYWKLSEHMLAPFRFLL